MVWQVEIEYNHTTLIHDVKVDDKLVGTLKSASHKKGLILALNYFESQGIDLTKLFYRPITQTGRFEFQLK